MHRRRTLLQAQAIFPLAGIASRASARSAPARILIGFAPGGAADLPALQKRETEMWAGIVKASGFSPED